MRASHNEKQQNNVRVRIQQEQRWWNYRRCKGRSRKKESLHQVDQEGAAIINDGDAHDGNQINVNDINFSVASWLV